MQLLHLFSFNQPISWAVLSEKETLHCAFSMRNGVKDGTVSLHFCFLKIFKY